MTRSARTRVSASKFLKYGFGFGGPCFPRDNRALNFFAPQHNCEVLQTSVTDEMNRRHLAFQVNDFLRGYAEGEPIHFSYVTYKPGTEMLDESQPLALAVLLAQAGRSVVIHESPRMVAELRARFGDLFEYCDATLRSKHRLQEVAVPLKRGTSWLLLALCVMALIVLDPTAVPPRRLWYEELARLKRQLDTMPSDFEKTTYLREYVGGLIDIGRPDDRTRHLYQSVNLENFDATEFFPRFRGHSLPAECGITTFFYIKLLQAFGYKAYQYSFGFTEQPYARFIHSVVLVNIDFRGTRRLIIQDPYLDLSYRDPEGAPIDFLDFLAALHSKEYRHVVMDTSSVATSLQVPDPTSYYPFLSESCRVSMTAALRREDGSLRTRIPIIRSYATLMQSPCGNFEAAFVDVMRKHELQEPFVYSYMLRASELVGSPDHREMQERIDAVRRMPPSAAVAEASWVGDRSTLRVVSAARLHSYRTD